MSIVLIALIGLSIGIASRLMVPAKEAWSWLVSIACGVLGAGLGAAFGRILGLYREGDPAAAFAAAIGAALLVFSRYSKTRRRRWREGREIR